MNKREDIYRWIRLGGFLSYIPVALLTGPLAGYVVGDYLTKRFGIAPVAVPICAAVGTAAGITETVRIIRLVLRLEKRM